MHLLLWIEHECTKRTNAVDERIALRDRQSSQKSRPLSHVVRVFSWMRGAFESHQTCLQSDFLDAVGRVCPNPTV